MFGLRYKGKAEFTGGLILVLMGCKILLADHPEFQNWIDWLERDIQDWTQRRAYALEPFDQVRREFCRLPPLPVRAAGRLLSPEVKEQIFPRAGVCRFLCRDSIQHRVSYY